MASRFSVL